MSWAALLGLGETYTEESIVLSDKLLVILLHSCMLSFAFTSKLITGPGKKPKNQVKQILKQEMHLLNARTLGC